MKYSNSFDYDLEWGEKAESWVKEMFSGGFKVEVKCDNIAHATKNIFIEIYCNGKPSGISTTEANYWIYKIEKSDIAVIISTDKLKKIIKDSFRGKFTKGGDNNTSEGILIPIKTLF